MKSFFIFRWPFCLWVLSRKISDYDLTDSFSTTTNWQIEMEGGREGLVIECGFDISLPFSFSPLSHLLMFSFTQLVERTRFRVAVSSTAGDLSRNGATPLHPMHHMFVQLLAVRNAFKCFTWSSIKIILIMNKTFITSWTQKSRFRPCIWNLKHSNFATMQNFFTVDKYKECVCLA